MSLPLKMQIITYCDCAYSGSGSIALSAFDGLK